MPRNMRAGNTDLRTELDEGSIMVGKAAERATRTQDKERLALFSRQLKNADVHFGAQLAKNPELTGLMGAWPDLELSTELQPLSSSYGGSLGSALCGLVRIFSTVRGR